ncbi:hypothetical protein NZK35_19930 [Stieleria sp. ICT_E10.1]|uniref:hypothetical protein n=1 Tax=Stieleria sedimenti TaxID=2976331 RepID=UPI00217FAA12|nr:hypothetical protein [Stieleria sedimenti]MCS7468929.1 hypothetical protein [Stieleria sedimenti]
MITGQATQPNDSEYVPELLEGLTQIGAEAAWDQSVGSMQTVVGVVDSGIDLDHRDLFLNIWINQGEIPADLGAQDIDGDGLITFYDLNNLRVIDGVIYVASTVTLDGDGNLLAGDLATAEQLTNETPYASGVNAPFVQDRVAETAANLPRTTETSVSFFQDRSGRRPGSRSPTNPRQTPAKPLHPDPHRQRRISVG